MPRDLDFYFWPTPNGWKVSILLEELGIPYNLMLIDIGAGAQFSDAFTAISPNQRMPAIVDYSKDGSAVPVFESGAIMIYLAEKHQRFIPTDALGRKEVMEWMFWQVGNLGPMAGQHSHFFNYAPEPEKAGYSSDRYRQEFVRCISVLERRLMGRDYLLKEYSIADMCCWPWILIAKAMGVSLESFPNVVAWRQRIKERPAVQRGVALAKERQRTGPVDDDQRRHLFKHQT